MKRSSSHRLVIATLLALLGAMGCDAAGGARSAPTATSGSPAVSTDVAPSEDPVEPPTASASRPPAPLSGGAARLVKASNSFGFALWAKLPGQSSNQLISPASLTTALAMTWGGAKGQTAAEMSTALRLDGSPSDVMKASGELVRAMTDPNRGVVLRVANRLFGEQTYRFEQPFLDATRDAYGAALEKVDFIHAAEPSRLRINAWVEGETQKRVKNLVPPGAIDGGTRLALVNAIYFLGDWAEAFPKDQTRPAPFFFAKDQKVEVATMQRRGTMLYAEQPGLQALELPYKGGTTSMLLLVPTDRAGLSALERSLDADRLAEIVGALRSETVAVWIPRFQIEPAESLKLGEPLRALGMKLAFDRRQADFTGIANPPTPDDRFFIGQVFHKGFVRVDEQGTEAAAATAVVMGPGGAAPSKTYELRADRPFLFCLRDRATGLLLFLGRVVDPRAR